MERAPLTVWVVLALVTGSDVSTAEVLQGVYITSYPEHGRHGFGPREDPVYWHVEPLLLYCRYQLVLVRSFQSAVLESGIRANVTSSSVMRCLTLCQRTPGCRGVSRHMTGSNTCRLHDTTVLSPDIALQAHPDWTYFELSQGAEAVSPWQLVFRATAGIGKSVLAAWDKVGHHDDLTAVPPGCLTTNGQFFCDRHFRSFRLDNWHNVTEVKLALYDKGTKVVDMVFNGTGSDYKAWFSKTRLLSSPWRDLMANTTTNFDSVVGDTGLQRRFFLNRKYSGCPADEGWMCVSDAFLTSSCAWDIWGSLPPVFSYSPLNTSAVYTTSLAHADVMAVYAKLSNQP